MYPELRIIYFGKVAEAQGRSVLEAFLEAEKEDPSTFKRKNKDAVAKSLGKFELVNTILLRLTYNSCLGGSRVAMRGPDRGVC